jgi:hypothetical protein
MAAEKSFDIKQELARERLLDCGLAEAFVNACIAGHIEALHRCIDELHDRSVDGWRLAFKKIVGVRSLKLQVRLAFLRVWIESKSIQRRVGDDLLTIQGLKRLTPAYRGPALKLFRGDSFLNRRRRTYGLAWTTSREVALRHALHNSHRMWPGGSVLLEARAPASAIITTSHLIGDHYGEEEYVVDRRKLRSVKVLENFLEIKVAAMSFTP